MNIPILNGEDVTHFNEEEIKNDVKIMTELGNFEFYAHPFGVYNDTIINELKNNNYKMAFKFGPGKEYRKARRSDDDFKVARLNISDKVSFTKFLIRLYAPF